MTLVFSIHYFLWYGALTSIFGYESVYARRYTKATTMQYGYLKMVLPFLTVIATPFMCSMADRHRSHRSYFTLSLIFTTVSLCFYALLPLLEMDPSRKVSPSNNVFKPDGNQIISTFSANISSSMSAEEFVQYQSSDQSNGLLVGPWIYYCLTSLMLDLALAINTCLADSYAILQAEELGSSFGRIIVWGTIGWASTALALSVINQWKALPLLLPGLLFSVVLLTIDVFVVTFWRKSSDFKLDLMPLDVASTLTGSSSPGHKDPTDYLPLNESARVNLGMELDQKNGSQRRNTKSPVEMISETVVHRLVRDLPCKSGSIKTINSELDPENPEQPTSVKLSPKLDSASASSASTTRTADLLPQSIFLIDPENPFESSNQQVGGKEILISSPKTINTDLQVKPSQDEKGNKRNESDSDLRTIQFTSFKMQLVLLGMILKRRKSLIRYLLLFVLSGFFMSMHWNYFFLYLEDIYYDQFALISALSMVGQSILGELPFFILSRKVIDYFGRSYTLSISLISIGVRFLLYGYMLPNLSMYSIIIADCLQGPNYGLFYVVMTEVGLEYSYCDEDTIDELAARGEINRDNKRQVDMIRLSLRSTIQSMAYACYEGIGVGLGSLAGGWLKNSYGFRTLWTSTAIASISIGLINALIELAVHEKSSANSFGGRKGYQEAHKNGTLKKLVPPRLIQSATALPANKQQRSES